MSDWYIIFYPTIGLAITCIHGGYSGAKLDDIAGASLIMMFIWPFILMVSFFTWVGATAKKLSKV